MRDFSPARVPAGVIEDLVRAASTAPSGAHRQPWTFVAVSDPEIKRRIRIAAEREEHENYGGRMPDEWLRALEPLGTDEHKPFLEIAPWLVVLFRQNYGLGCLLIPVGYPAADARVPDLRRKPLEDVLRILRE